MANNDTSKHIAESLQRLNQARQTASQGLPVQVLNPVTGGSKYTDRNGSKTDSKDAFNYYSGGEGWGGDFGKGLNAFLDNDANVPAKVIGTVRDVENEIAYGTTKIVEGVVDLFAGLFGWVGTWFGADDKWAKDFISYDASRWFVENVFENTVHPEEMILKTLTGESMASHSYLNNADQGVQDFVRGAGQFVGYIAPSVIAAIFTGGASVGVEAGSWAISGTQLAVAGISAAGLAGQSVEGAVQENPDVNLGSAVGYGAIKGGISFGLDLATMGLASGVGKAGVKAGEKVLEKTGSKVLEVVTSKATQIALKAGLSGARAATLTASDPMVKQLTGVDTSAIEKAYGSSEAWQQTMTRVGQSFGTAALASAAMNIGAEGISLATKGTDGYMANYQLEKANMYQREAIKLMKKTNDDLAKGKDVDMDKVMAKLDELTDKMNNATSSAIDYSQKVYDAAEGETSNLNGAQKKVLTNTVKTAQRSSMISKMNEWVHNGNQGGEAGVVPLGDSTFKPTGETTGVYTRDDTNYAVVKVGNDVAVEASPKTINLIETGSVPMNAVTFPKHDLPAIKGVDTSKPLLLTTSSLSNIKNEDNPIEVKNIPAVVEAMKNPEGVIRTKNGNYITVVKVGDEESYVTFKETKDAILIKNISKFDLSELGIEGKKVGFEVNLQMFAEKTGGEVVTFKSKGTADLVKQATNSLEGDLTTLKTTTDVVKHATNYIDRALKRAGYKDGELTISKKDLPRMTFEQINLSQDKKGAISKMVESIINASLKVDGEEYKLSDLLSHKSIATFRTKMNRDLLAIVESKATPTQRTKLINAFNRRIDTLLSRIAKRDDLINLSRLQIKELKNKSVAYRHATIEANRTLANIDLTRRQFKVDSRLYGDEIKFDGTLKSMLKMLPRVNMTIKKDGNIRFSDTQGLYLSSKYQEWAKNNIGNVQQLIDSGYLVNIDTDVLMDRFNTLAYNGVDGSKHLTVEQLNALTDIMKMLRYQISDKANNNRVERREVATKLHTELERLSKLSGGKVGAIKDKIDKMLADNVKLIEIGDYITGIDNSELQQRIDHLFVDCLENYWTEQANMEEKYLATKDINRLGKLLRGKVDFKGRKIAKRDLVAIYEQLQDSELRGQLQDNPDLGHYFKLTFSKGKLEYYPELEADIRAALGDTILDLDHQVIIRGIYNDKSSDSYIPRVKQWEVEHRGMSSIPDRPDGEYYVPLNKSSDFYQKGTSAEQIGKNEAVKHAGASKNLTERTQTGGKVVIDTYDPIAKAQKYLDGMAMTLHVTKDLNDFLSYFELNVTTNNGTFKVKEDLSGYMPYIYDLAQAIQGQGLIREGIISKIQGSGAVATLGAKVIFGPVKQLLSVGKVAHDTGSIAAIKGIAKVVANHEYLKHLHQTGFWKNRYKNGVLNALANTTVKGLTGKVGGWLTKFYEWGDEIATNIAASMYFEAVKKLYPSLGKDDLFKKADEIVLKGVLRTQSTDVAGAKSTASQGKLEGLGGRQSEIVKAAFTFQSDTIAGASMVIKDFAQLKRSITIMKNAEKVINDSTATDEEKDAARDYYDKAKKTRDNILKRRIPMGLAAILVGAVLKYMIEDLQSRVKGRKDWQAELFDEDTMGDLIGNTLESFVPYFSTIYSAVKYNSGKTELFAFSAINDILKGISEIGNNPNKGVFDIVMGVTTWLGVPLKTLYDDTVGIARAFNAEWAIRAHNFLYGVSTSAKSAELADAVKNKNMDKAVVYLQVLLEEEKGGKVADATSREMARLLMEGYVPYGGNIPTEYEDSKGNIVKLSDADKIAFRNVYSKANVYVNKLLREASYQKLDDAGKARAIKSIYSAYFEAAKSKVYKNYSPSSKFGTLVSNCGNMEVGRFAGSVSYIKSLQPTKTKTRKDLATKYVNKLHVSKAEKFLILYLAGFSLSDEAESKVLKYLRSRGMTAKKAKEFLNAE